MPDNISNYIAAGLGGIMMLAAVGALIATPKHSSQASRTVAAETAATADNGWARMDGIAAGQRLHAELEAKAALTSQEQVWEFAGLSSPIVTQTWEFEGLTPPVTEQQWEFEGLEPPTTEQVWEFSGLRGATSNTGPHPEASLITLETMTGFHGYPTASIRSGSKLMTASGEALMAP